MNHLLTQFNDLMARENGLPEDAAGLQLIDQVEAATGLPLREQVSALAHEDPQMVGVVKGQIMRRVSHALGRLTAEQVAPRGPEAARNVKRDAEALSDFEEKAISDESTMAFLEGRLEGSAGRFVHARGAMDSVRPVTDPTGGEPYRDRMDMSLAMPMDMMERTDQELELLLRTAHFEAQGDASMIAVRRVEAALIREELENRARDNLRRRVLQALDAEMSMADALRVARTADDASMRERTLPLEARDIAHWQTVADARRDRAPRAAVRV